MVSARVFQSLLSFRHHQCQKQSKKAVCKGIIFKAVIMKCNRQDEMCLLVYLHEQTFFISALSACSVNFIWVLHSLAHIVFVCKFY